MKVGFASADVTPAVGMECPGGFSKAYHQKIHDHCYAKAMIIEHADEVVAFVGLDTLSVKRSMVEAARALITEKTGIPGAAVMVGASHTHASGPIVGAFPGAFAHAFDPAFCEDLAQNNATAADPDYCRHVSRQIATAVIEAFNKREEAGVAIGRGAEPTVAFNRRFWMQDGTQMTHPGKGNPNIVRPAGPADPEVGVLSAWRPDGSFLGCLVNFTCHGTTGNGGTSADWIHWLRQTITRGMGGGEVVFLNGACGDVTQVNNLSLQESEFGEKWSRRVGQKVGAEALKVLAMAEPGELLPLAAKQTFVDLPARDVPEDRFQEALAFLRASPPEGWDKWWAREVVLLHEANKLEPIISAEIQALQVGPVVFVSNGAEYFCQFGLNIKSRSPFPFTYVVELANGSIGYVPTAEAMGPQGGGYEPRMATSSRLVPEAGQMIEDASVALAQSLTPAAAPEAPQIAQATVPWDAGSSKAKDV